MSTVTAPPAKFWWVGDPDVVACPDCGCPIQATSTGTITDGLRRHRETVHRRPRSVS